MKKKLFKLSKYVTPSSVSNFCDGNGRMLNKEVVKVLNEQQSIIQSLKEENKELKREHHILYAFLIDNGLEEKYLKWRKRNIREPYKIPSITYEIKEYQSRLNIDGKVIDDEC